MNGRKKVGWLTVLAGGVLIAGSVAIHAGSASATQPVPVLPDPTHTQSVDLHNDTAGTGDCPDAENDYWHFVIAPNHSYAFIEIWLNINNDSVNPVKFSGSDIIVNSSYDNVFVKVPSGHELTDLDASGSWALISPDTPAPQQFNLSHVCDGTVVDSVPDTIVETTPPPTDSVPDTIVETTPPPTDSVADTIVETTPPPTDSVADTEVETTPPGTDSNESLPVDTSNVGQESPTTTTTTISSLPTTGTSTASTLMLGAFLVLLGLVVVALGRREQLES